MRRARDHRCPPTLVAGIELAATRDQEIATWLAAFSDAAMSYVHHAVACATAEDVTELRELIHADDDALDALYAPEPLALADHDPRETMYAAMSALTRRHSSPRASRMIPIADTVTSLRMAPALTRLGHNGIAAVATAKNLT